MADTVVKSGLRSLGPPLAIFPKDKKWQCKKCERQTDRPTNMNFKDGVTYTCASLGCEGELIEIT